jgi:hypothetical protein
MACIVWHLPIDRFVCLSLNIFTLVLFIESNIVTERFLKFFFILEMISGPHDAFVPKSFGLHRELSSMAAAGFCVVKIDGKLVIIIILMCYSCCCC